MASESKLKLLLDLQDNVSKELEATAESIQKVDDQTKNLKETFATAAVVGTAGFAAISAGVLKTYGDYMSASLAMEKANLTLKNSLNDLSEVQMAKLKREGAATGQEMEYLQGVMENVAAAAEQVGIDGEDASVAFSKLFSASGDVQLAFEDSATAMDLAAYSGQSLESATQALIGVYAGNTRVLKQFGIEVEEGTTALDAMAIVSGKVYGAAEKLKNPMDVLGIQIGNLSENIGQAFAPAINSALEAMIQLITRFSDWAVQNPNLIATIAAVSLGLFGLLAVVGTLGLAIPVLTTGFIALGGVFSAVGIAVGMLAAPVGIAIGVIAGLVAIGKLLYDNWDQISIFAQIAWTNIGNSISAAMNSAGAVVTATLQLMQTVFWTCVDFIIGAWASLLDFLVPGWDTALVKLWTATVGKFEMIKSTISQYVMQIIEWFTQRFAEFTDAWSKTWDNVKDVFTNTWNAVKSVADTVFKSIGDGINLLMGPINNLIDLCNKAIALAQSVSSAVGAVVGGAVSSIINRGSSITGKASGGSVTGGSPYIVGENGPELFVPGRSGSIVPNGSLIGAGAGGMNITINVSGTFLDDRDAALRMGDALVKYLKDNMNL